MVDGRHTAARTNGRRPADAPARITDRFFTVPRVFTWPRAGAPATVGPGAAEKKRYVARVDEHAAGHTGFSFSHAPIVLHASAHANTLGCSHLSPL